jgi:cation transport regulator ChaB
VETPQYDREVLAAVFASRVSTAKKTEDEAAEEAREEHRRTIAWVANNSQKEKSFLWFCDEFDLDAGAVRRAIQEKR